MGNKTRITYMDVVEKLWVISKRRDAGIDFMLILAKSMQYTPSTIQFLDESLNTTPVSVWRESAKYLKVLNSLDKY